MSVNLFFFLGFGFQYNIFNNCQYLFNYVLALFPSQTEIHVAADKNIVKLH